MWIKKLSCHAELQELARVALDMILRNPLYAGEETHKGGSTLALKSRADVSRSPKVTHFSKEDNITTVTRRILEGVV